MIGLLVFLIALPLSVYVIAGALAIVDRPSPSGALVSLTLRLGGYALLVALTPAESRIWIGGAFLTVLILHTLTAVATRYAIRSGRWPSKRID